MVHRVNGVEMLPGMEERYRTIFETTGCATIIIEEDTVISLANVQFERLSGIRQERIGR